MLASRRLWPCRFTVFSMMVTLMFAWLASTTPLQGGGTPKKSQYKNYLKQLHDRFQAWDLNTDNTLDKAELAKAFRGPQAKPYDYAPDQDTDDDPLASKPKKGKVKRTVLAMVCLPQHSLPVNLVLAELLTKPDKAKTSGINPAVQQYGDFQFLALIGKNDKIAKQDYDNWSKSYAKNLDQYQEGQKEVKKSQDKLTKLANSKDAKKKQAANNELGKHQADLAGVSAQLNAISPAIQAGLNVKR